MILEQLQTQGKHFMTQYFAENAARTHDRIYLAANPLDPPKESFRMVANIIGRHRKSLGRRLQVADFGCATGAFVNFLMECFPDDDIVGFEYLEELVAMGRRHFPTADIRQESVLNSHALRQDSVDVISLLGVLSIFDDIDPVLTNLIHWTRPGGKVLVHGMFNPSDVDVYIRYRLSEDYGTNHFESGWNVVSQTTFSDVARSRGAQNVTFHAFQLPFDLFPWPHDPLRSWTETLADGSRQIINGMCLKQPQFIAQINV